MANYEIPTPIFDKVGDLGYQRLPANISFSSAKKDFKIAQGFLSQYYANPETLKAYRREIERLLQWAWLIAKKSVLKLTREDIEFYIEFCLDPPKSWIGLKRAVRFITRVGKRVPNPEWRPFIAHISKAERKLGKEPDKSQYQLSSKAIQAIFAVLGSLYSHLVDEGTCKVNPVRQIKQKKSKYLIIQQGKREVRRLSDEQWKTVIATAEKMADSNEKKHERTLFIVSAMYHMYLRISELVATERWKPLMNHFYRDSNNRWWFKTVGKGNKERIIVVNDDMLVALQRYRKSRSLLPLPSPADTTPIVVGLRNSEIIKSTVQIRRIVQECFDIAINTLLSEKKSDEANSLQEATVHWLRHTGISNAINKDHRPIAHVRDDAGHSSAAITDIYNDADLQARHESAQKKRETEGE
jgi:site-specific recombinase XerD